MNHMRTLSLFSIVFFFEISLNGQSGFQNFQAADMMISGVDFNNSGGALQFNHPNGLASDGKNLLICDRFNNRVLIWNTAPTSFNTAPDLVLGQADFISNNPGTEKSKMNWPGNVSVSKDGKLAITDTNNDRLLLWNKFPNTNGQSADISIHLPTISPTQVLQKWAWPWGVWTDGTRLAAVATMGSALLFWNSFPTTDNQAPDYTISLPQLGTPRNISTDGHSYFFVGDHNAKVNGVPGTFFWNSYPSKKDQAYDFYKDEWIKGTSLSTGEFIASGIRNIYIWSKIPNSDTDQVYKTASPPYYDNGDGVDVVEANGKIYVCNYNGNNVLVYSQTPDQNNAHPDFALGIADYYQNTLDSIAYIQNPVLATDGKKLVITSDYDQRIYLYKDFPNISGQFADQIISTQNIQFAAWDNAIYNHTFAACGKQTVRIWDSADDLSKTSSKIFNGRIGNAHFLDLKGIALDQEFFYLADRSGKVFIWKGIPLDNTINPDIELDLGNVVLNRLSSDGEYLCVTQQSPGAIHIYRVEDLKNKITNPWKIIQGIGFLNLPSEAITFNGSLAIANTGFHDVLIWNQISDAPNPQKMIVLGNPSNVPSNIPAIGRQHLFMPGSLLFHQDKLWVGEFKFSSRVLRYSADLTQTKDEQDKIKKHNIIMYPNPAHEKIYFDFTDSEIEIKSILIRNIHGVVVQSINVDPTWNFSISLEELNSGIYHIEMISDHQFSLFHEMLLKF